MNAKKAMLIAAISVATLGVGVGIFFGATPIGRQLITGYNYDMEKAGENNYENRRMVEEQCRAYIASYKADKLGYEQYKDSDSELERSWAQSYKQRANRTAATYNEFMTKNSYVFKDNLPWDIPASLPYLN